MESQFTYEHLSNDPTGLLHKRNVAAPIGPFDGRLGALVEKGWFMVTPNALGLYQPSLGINREMYMRADFRYAADDPLLWPQFYVRSDPWLSCIRKRPKDPLDPFLPLYNPVARSDFSTSGSASQDSQLGKFSDASFICLRAAAQKVIDMSESQSWGSSDSLLKDFRRGLCTLLHCLESLPFIFDRIRLAVAETQRVAIEMRAIMDYITIYRPRMLATNVPSSTKNIADTELIGAFTTDPIIVEEFFRARIPVWLLLKLDRLPFTRIDAYTSPLEPNQYLNIESPRIRLRSVFIGASDQAEKYKAFRLFTRNHLRLPNPFALVPGEVRLDPPLPEPLSSTRGKPYDVSTQRAKQKHPSQSNQTRFLSVIVHPRLPPAIPVWQAAVESTSSDRSRCYPEARIAEANGYIFPRPDIFIGAQDEHKALELVKAWLCLRPLLLARVSCSSYSAQPVAHQSWRIILNLDHLMKNARSDGASSSRSTPTKAERRREQAVAFLQGCAGELQIDTKFNVGPAVWRGIELEMLTNDHHREIAWELAELNFRTSDLAAESSIRVSIDDECDALLEGLPAFDPTEEDQLYGSHNLMRSKNVLLFSMWSRSFASSVVHQSFRVISPILRRLSFVPETCEEMYTERSGLVFDIAQFHEQ
ncbi:uncharacterized protein EV420DRAFT_1669754 [Desarmillaria tabescens]|uniref:Uncharacterized protein n=1 Tax=Armillaria tabescens TaxID=1929756 RepID=A0AA39J7F1_ARMTA|nr:uncharacterized protein EV420DRAFT_1669754 [Desarmillaria tabescens]KAK0437438.1 hypothetical protein EV420DRAFT_1669754 [Desarmillaria tabescens]